MKTNHRYGLLFLWVTEALDFWMVWFPAVISLSVAFPPLETDLAPEIIEVLWIGEWTLSVAVGDVISKSNNKDK